MSIFYFRMLKSIFTNFSNARVLALARFKSISDKPENSSSHCWKSRQSGPIASVSHFFTRPPPPAPSPPPASSPSFKLPLLCAALGLLKPEKDDEEVCDDGFDDMKNDEVLVDEEPVVILESSRSTCKFCCCNLAIDERSRTKKGLMCIYTRDGTLFARHLVKRCQSNRCRAGHFLGYTVKDNIRRYEPDVLQTSKYLGKAIKKKIL